MLREPCVMHWLSRRSSKLSNCIEKVHRDMTVVQLSTHIVDSSRCIEHIINTLQHRVKHVKVVKTEDSTKPISGSQCMKSSSTKTFDQCLPIGRWLDREPKLSGLMICSGASDGAINVYPGRGGQKLRRPTRLGATLNRVTIGYTFVEIVTELKICHIYEVVPQSI
jgi:hypothetical protein